MKLDIRSSLACGRIKLVVRTIAATVALLPLVRFAYLVSQIDGGWSRVAAQWRAGTLGRFVPQDEPVSQLEPPKQAAFWLANVERIVAEPGNSAQLAMGAAWILDAPSPQYIGKHLESPPVPGLPPSMPDTERLERAFEERCSAKCTELAQSATRSEPANVNWWRMRALLRSSLFAGVRSVPAPRAADWAEVLDEAARHDADNALYDYLAAVWSWKAGGEYDFVPASFVSDFPAGAAVYTLSVRDAEQFASGNAHFDRGQSKKFVAFGEAGLPAIHEFLTHSGLPRDVQTDVARGTHFFTYAPLIMRELVRWQMARADERAGAGDAAGALRLAKQCLHVLDQVEAGGETSAYSILPAMVRQQVLTRIFGLAQANDGLVSHDDRAAMLRDLRAAVLRVKVWTEAGRRAAPPKPAGLNAGDVIEAAILGSTPECFGLLVLAGLAAWLAAVLLARRAAQVRAMAAWQHAVAWVMIWSIVYAVVGLAPAEVISRQVQPWLAVGAVTAALVSLGLLWRRSRYRFTLRTVFIATFVCAAICIPLAWLYRQGVFADVPRSLNIRPQGAGKLDANSLENALKLAPNSWTAATWQWFLHGGFALSALGSPLLVLVWSSMRRSGGKDGAAQTPPRVWWAVLLRDAARSALALAVFLLLFDLAVTPAALRPAEARYQEVMHFFRHPEETYPAARANIAAVEADAAAMDALRRSADDDVKSLLKPSGP